MWPGRFIFYFFLSNKYISFAYLFDVHKKENNFILTVFWIVHQKLALLALLAEDTKK